VRKFIFDRPLTRANDAVGKNRRNVFDYNGFCDAAQQFGQVIVPNCCAGATSRLALYCLVVLSLLMPLVVLSLLIPLLLSLAAGLVFDVLVFVVWVFVVWVFVLCAGFVVDFVAPVDASLVAGAFAAGAAASGAGAGVCAAAVSDTAKAPASSADINLVIFQSFVWLVTK
jgi:hypothetical protein